MRKTAYIFFTIGILISSCNFRNEKKKTIDIEEAEDLLIDNIDTLQDSNHKSIFEIVKKAKDVHFYNDDNDEIDTAYQTDDGIVYEFMVVEQIPIFPGGEDSLYSYIKRSIEYPQTAMDDNIQGKVYVSFVVLKDGSITQVEVIRGIRYDLEKVCVDAIKNMPNWKSGKLNGENINVRFIIPIHFTLDSNKSKRAIIKGEKNNQTSIEIKLYPNPAVENFNIEVSEYSNDMDYQLISANGQIIETGRFNADKITINTSNLGKGMYVVRIISKELGINKLEKIMINK